MPLFYPLITNNTEKACTVNDLYIHKIYTIYRKEKPLKSKKSYEQAIHNLSTAFTGYMYKELN